MRRGRLFTVSAPSGTGKTTLVERLVERVPDLVMSRSYTSRPTRPVEVDGVNYNFIERDRFEQMITGGDFLEWASIFGHLYGTSRADTERHRSEGKDVMLVIDVQGGRRVREQGVESVGIFVLPPSFAILEERLRRRSTRYSTEAQLRLRLETAREEVAVCSGYEHVVVNTDVDACVDQLRSIVLAERSKASVVREIAAAIAETFRAGSTPDLAAKNHGGATYKG